MKTCEIIIKLGFGFVSLCGSKSSLHFDDGRRVQKISIEVSDCAKIRRFQFCQGRTTFYITHNLGSRQTKIILIIC